MRSCRHARWLLHIAFLIPTLGGCSLIHPPVAVLIRDAETKAPIPNAVVTVRPINDETPNAVWPQVTTGADGIARIPAEQRGITILMLGVNAPGYLPGDLSLNDASRLAATLGVYGVVDVYAGPRPAVMLILPPNYKGPVRAEIQIDDHGPFAPGQREFAVTVTDSGLAELTGPSILRQWPGPEFRARYSDGTELPLNPKDDEIALRWVRGFGSEMMFVVGTKADWKARGGNPPPSSSQGSTPPAQKGGGRGGRGGGGGGRGGGGGGGGGGSSGGGGGS